MPNRATRLPSFETSQNLKGSNSSRTNAIWSGSAGRSGVAQIEPQEDHDGA